jgi:asparagine synthase (glutamine-hydrolysing)
MLWHVENPSLSGIEILHMVLSQATAKSFKVVATGEGSEEIFGGYKWFHADKLLRPFARLPLALRQGMLMKDSVPHRWKRAFGCAYHSTLG